jgi:release factor glutamine methyltransferase
MIIENIVDRLIINKIKKINIEIGEVINLNKKEKLIYDKYILKIKNSYPLDYIIGKIKTKYINLKIKKGVFIPRPCTEELIELVKVSKIVHQSDIILDICAGSGFIGLSLAKIFPNKKIILIENSLKAIEIIKENLKLNNINNVILLEQNALEVDYSRFSNFVIICNPPYVPKDNINNSVIHEPGKAIYSGKDGLTFFNKLIKILTNYYINQIFFELDNSNIQTASKKIKNFKAIKIVKDNENFERFLIVDN